MNRKQLGILLVLVVVLGAGGWLLRQRQQASWQSAGQGMGQKLLAGFQVTNVAAIVVKSGTNELNLALQGDLWRVKERGGYPANFQQIRDFVLKAEGLKATQIEEVGPSQLGRFKLLPPGPGTNTGVLVSFRDAAGKELNSLLLGKPRLSKPSPAASRGMDAGEGDPAGRYILAGADTKTVAVISDPLGTMDVKPEQWLNKDFFKVEKIRSLAVEFLVATNSWKVSREAETGNDWKLADAKPGEELDAAKTSSFSYALSSPTFNDVLPADTKPESVGLDQPVRVTLDTFGHFAYTLKVGAKTNDSYVLTVAVSASLPKERVPGADEKPDDKAKLDKEFKDQQKALEDKLAQEKTCEKWTYLVPSYTVDAILKERSQWLAAKKEEKPAAPEETNGAAQPPKESKPGETGSEPK